MQVEIRTISGRVEIATSETGETFVETADEEDHVNVELTDLPDGGHLVAVDGGAGRRRRGGEDLRLRLPESAHVRIESRSGDVTARGRFGSLVLRAASAGLVFDEVRGDVEVRVASGDVRGGTVDGNVTVESMSGDVELVEVGGDLTAHLASGDLTVRRALGSVKVSTASGDVTVGEVSAGAIAVTSMSGDIAIGVRRGVITWLDLSSVSGSITSELEPAGATSEGDRLELRASSVSGDVRVRRAGQP